MSNGKETTRSRQGRKEYISGIDGLRAIAVLMVLAYHLQMPFAKGGLLGVTVFFVISGFLITRILYTEIERTGTVDLGQFWLRRIRRLLPAVLTLIVTLILIGAVWNRVLFTKTCKDFLSVIFCYNNWWQIWNGVSYFENAGVPSPLTHCWSLAIESQFYLVYPLLLLILSRAREKKKAAAEATGLIALVSIALMWILFDPSKDPSRVYYGTDTRVFSLLFGALLALMEANIRKVWRKNPALGNVAGFASLGVLLCMMVMVNGYSSFLYRGGQAIVSLLSVLVIASLLGRRSVLDRILSLPPLRWIGERAYGLYLWHYPIILFVSGGKKSPWYISLAEIAAAVVCAALSYQFIETPVRQGVIRRNMAVIRSIPRTRQEKREKRLAVRRSVRAGICTLILGAGALLCVMFVPRETALKDAAEREQKAEEAAALAKEKAEKDQTAAGSSAEDSKPQEPKELSDSELLASLKILLIGDSIALDATDDFYAVFPNGICDASVGRYSTESAGVYNTYFVEKQWQGEGVIFALSTNGLMYDSLPTLREAMGPDLPLFIITGRDPYANWIESNNNEIKAFVEETENTYLIDWYGESEGHGEYFASDETHLSPEGAAAYIECIKPVVLNAYKNIS